MEQCASTASLLASVREQERQFEMLSRALEEERRSCAGTLPRPLPNMQNGRLPCDAEIERLTLNEGYVNGTHHFRMEPGQMVQETYTVEEEPQESNPVVSVETNEDGTTRRTETTVKKVVKTTTTRTVIPSVSDTLSLDGGGSVTGIGGYITPMDRGYRQAPGVGVPMEYPIHTVPRNYQYGPPGGYEDYRAGPPSESYASLNRGARMEDRYRPVHPDGYRTLDPSYRAPSRNQLDPYAAQPQVGRMGSAMELSSIPRFVPEPYGLEDDRRSMGYDEPDYGMGHPVHYSTVPRNHHGFPQGPPRRTGSYEGTLDGDMSGPGDLYYWGGGAPMAQGERGSMASLDSTLRKGPGPGGWRQPELPEVVAMLNYRLDPVRSNAAAYLQHLTYKNDKVKSEVRRLKGIPALVSMLDNPNKEVHYAACGALKNISYGKDPDNKIAIKNCDGVPALIRLLRKTHDQDLTDLITGTLWNLSSHDSVKMEIVDHALHALSDEVMVPHSGWERGSNGGGGEENCKPRHLEWETALTNTAGCLRNVSSERSEARRKLRECTGLVDSLMYIVQSQIDCKDVDNKLIENSVCLLRNLSYHVHREIPGCERYQEAAPVNQGPAPSSQKGGCFSSRKSKDEWFSKGKKDEDPAADIIDIPKRTTPAKGYELLFQPEVVRIYTSLLKESKNPTVLEASAGAVQNLCAGRWTYGRYIRALLRQEKGLPMMTELLAHGNDRVVRAMSGALRNLAIDARNRDLLGKHAVPHLVANLPGGGQSQPVRALSEETVVSVLSTLHEVLGSSLEAAKTLRASQGIERLVLINKDGNRSEREVRGAGLVLQTVWAYKELRRTLEKDGWKKTDFMVNLNPPSSNTRTNGGYEDSTVPLIDKGDKGEREIIPMNDMGPDAYSTLDQRGRRNTLDNTIEPDDKDAVQGVRFGAGRASLPLLDSYDEKLIVCITKRHPPGHCPC
ncbi:catenin delta-1 isoform X1 [Phyllopteryx taeniolatus]|uniref:catenin delta-1 isoform X1 n=2 Tax=Phyllopteryx taeniolatus TaxID=161469 RepID=UPI002AD3D064|nr:catenin delta-1 isoform X1 [Phyllopteryx taeniolatus]XP_061625963.1 catenin delta-1 isoform X1 [Phyllopteryx taeniolatus]XP_061625964.1 catenin delta-1 isoform X1 [Phyllopteryx taeniolatus]